ncbi:MAG: capsular biosynthesis protein, partial [Thermoplasmata archaeon]
MLSLTEDREFLQDAGIMFIASIVAGICNYLYQIYMGRALGVEEYGIFGSLFALSYIIFVVSGTIQTSCARFVSKFVGEGKEGNISYLLHGLLKRMFIFGIIVFVLFILSSGLISSFLKIESVLPVVIVGGFLFLSILLPVNLGALQG